MPALQRLLNFYNVNAWDPQTNPGGMLGNGHRVNFVPFLQDVGEVGEDLLGVTTETTRLRTFYETGDYDAGSAPGAFGNAGNRINYVPAIHDVADVATDAGLSGAAITRLASYYTGTRYNAISNTGGLAGGGHRINFEPSLIDAVTVGQLIAALASGTRARVTWIEIETYAV